MTAPVIKNHNNNNDNNAMNKNNNNNNNHNNVKYNNKVWGIRLCEALLY